MLDKNIEERDTPGNKYRRLCEACDRFGRMASSEEFASHPEAKFIPLGEPRDADHALPATALDETGGSPSVGETAADGGDPENEFDCPSCDGHCSGYPDACPHCDVPFQWGDDE